MVNETMTFMNLDMQKSLWERIGLIKKNNRVGSAYLFLGPNGSAKEAMALKLSAYLSCNEGLLVPCGTCISCKKTASLKHENCHLIVPTPSDKQLPKIEKKNTFLNEIKLKSENPFHKISFPKAKTIPISNIRNLKKELFLKSVNSEKKIIIIFDAHMLCTGDASSANAILKILEEPPSDTTFILVSDHKGKLLPTILSRCQIINFPPLETDEIISYLSLNGIDSDLAQFAARVSEGNMNYAQRICQNGINEVTQLIEKLTSLLTLYNEKSWRLFIQDYSKMAHNDYYEYKFHLFLIQSWLKQAHKKRTNENRDLLYDQMKENIENFNSRFPNARFDKINYMVEEIIAAPKKNFFMPIQLTNFLIGVQKRLIN